MTSQARRQEEAASLYKHKARSYGRATDVQVGHQAIRQLGHSVIGSLGNWAIRSLGH